MSISAEQFFEKLEKIIKKEEPLRQPPITVVHCPKESIKELYLTFRSKLKEFKLRYSDWNYYLINMEKELFKILDDLEYTDGDKFALNCTREDLTKDLKSSVLQDLIGVIEAQIDQQIKNNKDISYLPFVVLLNIHGCYSFIQTKDIISRIINKKDILIVILYLELSISKLKTKEDESYKLANYNVHSVHIKEIE